MNPQTKSAFHPITPQKSTLITPPKQDATAVPPKISNADRLEKQLVGKYFAFIFASGSGFRAGRIESIVTDSQFTVRYLRDGKFQKFTHIVRHYESPSIETLSGREEAPFSFPEKPHCGVVCGSGESFIRSYKVLFSRVIPSKNPPWIVTDGKTAAPGGFHLNPIISLLIALGIGPFDILRAAGVVGPKRRDEKGKEIDDPF